ncbi:MAG: hypothetical protein P4M10_03110 [Verrucomicrobiae bacterium]|nr:hypothetical protein [Verrucomicrobiae bacterium]
MSYVTVEVEIDHGQVLPKGGETLPDKASGLLTIFPETTVAARPVGLAKGQLVVPEGFNDPLPEEVVRAFEGR